MKDFEVTLMLLRIYGAVVILKLLYDLFYPDNWKINFKIKKYKIVDFLDKYYYK